IYSSRSVIKNSTINKNVTHFYKEDIWGLVNNDIYTKIEPGITLYLEIVGYLPTGKYIQKDYDYGANVGAYKYIVYRITSTSLQGNVVEFSWGQIKQYCL